MKVKDPQLLDIPLIMRPMDSRDREPILRLARELEEDSTDSDPFDKLLSSDVKKTRPKLSISLYDIVTSGEEIEDFPSYIKKRRLGSTQSRKNNMNRSQVTTGSNKKGKSRTRFTKNHTGRKRNQRAAFENKCFYSEILSPISSSGEESSIYTSRIENKHKMFQVIMNENKKAEEKLAEEIEKRLNNRREITTKRNSSQKYDITLHSEIPMRHKKSKGRKLQTQYNIRNKKDHSLHHQQQQQQESLLERTESLETDLFITDITPIEKSIIDKDILLHEREDSFKSPKQNLSAAKRVSTPVLQTTTSNGSQRNSQSDNGLKNPNPSSGEESSIYTSRIENKRKMFQDIMNENEKAEQKLAEKIEKRLHNRREITAKRNSSQKYDITLHCETPMRHKKSKGRKLQTQYNIRNKKDHSLHHQQQKQQEQQESLLERPESSETELFITDMTPIEKSIIDKDILLHEREESFRSPKQNLSAAKRIYTPVQKNTSFNSRQLNSQSDIGLKNPPGTNKCWMNASLQVILGMIPLIDDVLEFVSNCKLSPQGGKYSSMLIHFINIMKAKQNNKDQLHDAVHEFHKSLRILSEEFTSYQQQDVAEFITQFFSALTEEFNGLRNSHQSNNPINENLTFKVEEIYSCKKCRKLRRKESLSNIMNITIVSQECDDNQELEKMIEGTMKTELREYNCEYCDSQQTEVSTRFVSLSKFLLLQLNRFQVKTNRIEKVRSNVRIPEALTLRNAVNVTNIQLPEELSLSNEPHLHNYQLIGMISHIGEYTSSGHYVADVYSMKTKTWVHYDDEYVRITDKDSMKLTKDGYIFAYMYKPLFNRCCA